MNKRVVVGLSGGVDSAVAAYLLKRDGYDVIGVHMRIWNDEDGGQAQNDGGCCGLTASDDARRVSDVIGIPFYVLNFRDVFRRRVVDDFIESYKNGRTPNPCIACNRYVKWEALLERAMELGADFIATGHYAKIGRDAQTGRYALAAAADAHKDQTYALYSLTQEQLARTLMPIGDYDKPAVRDIAEGLGLCVARKPDSQEICFIPDDDYGGFLEKQFGAGFGAGRFVDAAGNAVGEHRGYYRYTVGQRRGLGVGFGKRVYALSVDPISHDVTLGGDEALYRKTATAADVCFMGIDCLPAPRRASAKIRYNHKAADCEIHMDGGKLICEFDAPQRAAAPGQALVCYDGGRVLCGGTIV